MAYFKAKIPVIATIAETDNAAPTYSAGMAIGKLIQIGITPNMNEGSLYGDDALAEYIREFSDYDVSLNVTTLPAAARAVMFGETYTEATTGQNPTPAKIVSKGSDSCPYVGFGFVTTETVNGAMKYAMVWLHKVKFSLPAETYDTKGDSITFGTPTVEGKGTEDNIHEWRTVTWHDTEAEAIAALKNKAGIS